MLATSTPTLLTPEYLASISKLVRSTTLLSAAKHSSYLLSLRALLEVLQELEIEAAPLPVSLIVMNADYWQRVDQQEGKLPSATQFRHWQNVGAWATQVGFKPDDRPGRWNGHVVAWLPQQGLICDPCIDRVNNLSRKISVSPVCAAFDGKAIFEQDGCRLTYATEVVSNHSYLRATEWTVEARVQSIVSAVLRKVDTVSRAEKKWGESIY